MAKLSKFLIENFIPIFLTIFLILFLITSIIITISISNITASIHITTYELFKMYMLSLPRVIFIAISISFFIALNSLFSKLSESQEIIAIFASGVKPFKLVKPFLFIALGITLINLIILFITIPYAKNSFENFKAQKKQEAKFNFQTSQISQKFGEWSVFAKSKNNKFYKEIILFNPQKNELIIANKASLNTKGGYIQFKLHNGNVYFMDKRTFIVFKKMNINQKIKQSFYSIFNFSKYYKKFKKTFNFYLPFALLPIGLLFFIPIISIFHSRLHKNHSTLYSIIILILYLLLTKISKNIEITLLISFVFFVVGFLLFKRRVKF